MLQRIVATSVELVDATYGAVGVLDDSGTRLAQFITVGLSEDQRVAVELLATLREALSNVARHAEATRVDVEIMVEGDVLVRVADDGIGPPGDDTARGKGLANMAARAAKLGGTWEIHRGEVSGTVLEWRVPKG